MLSSSADYGSGDWFLKSGTGSRRRPPEVLALVALVAVVEVLRGEQLDEVGLRLNAGLEVLWRRRRCIIALRERRVAVVAGPQAVADGGVVLAHGDVVLLVEHGVVACHQVL